MTGSTAAPVRTPSDHVVRRALRNPTVVVSGLVLLLVVAAAVLAPLLAPHSPTEAVLDDVLAPPSADHPLGGDSAGRDVLSRLLWGARTSLLAGLIAIVTAVVVGVPAGLVAGYRSGRFDAVAGWVASVLLAVPGIVALLVVVSAFGTAMPPSMIALGVLLSPSFFRLTRSTVVNVRAELYVDAARVAGISPVSIVFRHILSVVATPIIIQASLSAGVAIIVQAGLAFLGIGDSLAPSWGAMVNDAYRSNIEAPLLTLWPGLAIGITVAALALLGSGLSDVVNRTDAVQSPRRSRRLAAEAAAEVAAAPKVEARTSEGATLVVEDLHVQYSRQDGTRAEVVKGVSFHVDRGECLGIVGESGSGKSQTAFSVLGLLPPEAIRVAGAIRLRELDLLSLGERSLNRIRSSRLAYVPQDPMSNLDPAYTVGAQMVETIRAHERLSRRAAAERARALLERVLIVDPDKALGSYPHEISGGMAQRVLIAMAISCSPDVLIADEPTTALDVTVQQEVLDLLRELQRDLDLALVIVTHNLGVVADICDRVAVMKDGRLVETRDVFDLFAAPEHPYTRELLGSTLSNVAPRTRIGQGSPSTATTEA
ncbi:dipeptide/oligopeptide/nickel ABC transporter permease/ATP-binding protein [Nocardioides bruguierae]|uniref:dipeptide/oligopeptide/nickel ABC transporter permease/ATP-binding protein n=1 Tax=Nocardioides bruguierae TaxID=2945102 RepID=UPI0020224393|nr:dipeptide/oligopeptide/nickel ABC transporter permease/ATP-binding protein [Nocardioides bruguierae]MCL8026892.1 dipeptide/oligopeptide/nickel ABC transporter permease/ATP-binding protein [Nocardioides bruguierae]